MRINYPERIQESIEALAELERQLRRRPTSARVQMLRLLKSRAVTSLPACGPLIGYSLTQLKRWWAAYQQGGLATLLTYKTPPGKRSPLTAEAWAGLQVELRAATWPGWKMCGVISESSGTSITRASMVCGGC